MKIVVCGSMTLSKRMMEIERELSKRGHKVILPKFTKEYAELDTPEDMHKESVKNKIDFDLIREYFGVIGEGDAVLIVNENKNGIENYVGGNSFLEMSFGHVQDKKLFLFNSIPNMIYTDEIIAMKPIVINGDYDLIK